MNRRSEQKKPEYGLINICRCMMEEGYYPVYEKTHILFKLDDNIAVVEYSDNVLSIRVFFTIEEEMREMFMEASNRMMAESYLVKPVILDDRKSILFSCEFLCENIRQFRRLFPIGIERLTEALLLHKCEIKRQMLSEELAASVISASKRECAPKVS